MKISNYEKSTFIYTRIRRVISNCVQKSIKGSITVEASIIIPTVILVLVALMAAFMLLYQKSILVKTATLAAQQGTEIWVDSRKDIVDGSWDDREERDSLYFRLFDASFSLTSTLDMKNGAKLKWEKTGNDLRDKKVQMILNLTKNSLMRGLVKPDNTKVALNYTNSMVEGKLEVIITQEIEIPLGWIKSFFDGKKTITLTAKGVAVVAQPAEYIRNIDFALEYANKLKDNTNLSGMMDGLKSKIKK